MSILGDFEKIRNDMGHEKYDAIAEYLNEICPANVIAEYEKELKEINNLEADEWLKKKDELENKYNIVRLDDILYKQQEFKKFNDWYESKKNKRQVEAKNTSKKEKTVTEWAIIFKDDVDDYDGEFYTENEQEYLDLMKDLKAENKLHTIHQAYRKDYKWNYDTEDWEEDNVEVLYDNVNDTTPLTESEEEHSIEEMVTFIKDGFEAYKQNKGYTDELVDHDLVNEFFTEIFDETAVDEDSIEAMNIAEADIRKRYNLKESKELTESEESIPTVLSYNEYDGGWGNNPTTYYGKLSDGTFYMYCPDNSDEIGIYDEPLFTILDLYYYNTIHDEEIDTETYLKQIEEYEDKHLIKSISQGTIYRQIMNVIKNSGNNIKYSDGDVDELKVEDIRIELEDLYNSIKFSFTKKSDGKLSYDNFINCIEEFEESAYELYGDTVSGVEAIKRFIEDIRKQGYEDEIETADDKVEISEDKATRNEKLTKDIVAFLKQHKIDGDVIIYYNGKRLFVETGKEENADVTEYLEYGNPDTISMSFEGELYYILNRESSDVQMDDYLTNEFEKILKKYNMYYEMGDAWNLTTYENVKTESKHNKVTVKESIEDSSKVDMSAIEDESVMTEEDAKESIKKEIYQYAKQEGLDVERLRKRGIELSEVAKILDTVVGDMVSKSAIEYEDTVGYPIGWDFEIADNDIKVEIMKR